MDSLVILQNALDKAEEMESFHVRNLLDNHTIVIWGGGNRFRNGYKKYFLPNNIKVSYIVDINQELWGGKIWDITCISPEQLLNMDDVVVIPMVYNGIDMIKQFCEENSILWIHRSQFLLDLNDDEAIHRDKEWFIAEKQNIFKVYNLLNDEESKEIYAKTIYNRVAHGFNIPHYEDIYEKYGSGEYFEPYNCYKLSDNENFIDVGAYNGDTIQTFMHITNNKYNNIYALEMDRDNYNELSLFTSKIKDVSAVHLYNCGAWNEELEVNVNGEGMVCRVGERVDSDMIDSEINHVTLKTIDSLGLKNITLIKMDIEGAEVKALEGARKTIEDCKPKLAICVYHRFSDFWKVPLLIKEINPEYKIAVRHHSDDNGGTVCYAWM